MNQNNQSPKSKRILIIILCVVIAVLLALGVYLLVRNSKLNQENADLAAANEQTAAQLSDLQQSMDQPANDLVAANQQIEALQAEYDTYKADAQTQLDAAVAAGQADVQTATDSSAEQLSALQTEFDAYKADADAAQAALQTEYDAYKADAQTALDAAVAAGQADVQAARDADAEALSALQAEYDAYKADAEAAAAEGTTDTTDTTGTTDATGATEPDGADALAALQADFDAYKVKSEADLAAAAEQLTALQSEYDAYKADAEAKAEATEPADQTTADTGAEALAALQTQFDTYKADAQAAQAALQTQFDTYKADAQTQLDAAVAAGRADVQTATDSGAEQLSALQSEFDSYKASAADQLSALQTEFDAYKATAADQLATLQTSFDTYQTTAEASLTDVKQSAAAAEKLAAESAIPTDVNGAANQANGNLAVFYEGNIYYNNNYQNGNIYVENAAGYDDVYLRRTSSGDVNYTRNIAAVEDGGLFYLNSNRLYRLDLETGDSEFLKNNMDLYSDSAMLIYDDRIYFLKSVFDANGEPADNLYLIDFRCNNLENVPGVSAYAFVGAGRTLYYIEAGTYDIVKYDLADQTGAAILQAGGSKITCLTLADDMLYFCKDGQLMSMTADGANAAAIGSVQAGSVNVIGGWIYYTNLNDSEKIYRITTGGAYDELICDVENACCLSIAGDWLYFIQYAGQGDQRTVVDTYKVKLDGTGLTTAKP